MWFTRISIQNPVFSVMLMFGLTALGLFAYTQLPVEEMPNVAYPSVLIQTEYPGAAPEIVESELSRPIERRLTSIPGLKNISSVSFLGTSQVKVEFELSANSDRILNDVRAKVDEARVYFRKEVLAPTITQASNASGPVVSIALVSSEKNPRQLTGIAEQSLRHELEAIPGVSSVTVVGGLKRQLRIELLPERLRSYGVGANQVIEAIEAENREVPVGNIEYDETERIVQVKGELREPDDFRRMVVLRRSGQSITLGQLAHVQDAQEEPKSVAMVNGKRAITIDVRKTDGANTLRVIDAIKHQVGKWNVSLRSEAVSLDIISDASLAIRESLWEVQKTLLEGALLTMLIVWLFLGSWRSTIITGLTLPVALIGSVFFLYLFGFSINGMTLIALSLSVGLVIDDAIVVRENIIRHVEQGKPSVRAALDGTAEIGLAVLGTTLTIVAVFLPVGFMGGIIGRFLAQFGIAVCSAVLISMFVSFSLDPMLSAVWPDPAPTQRRGWLSGITSGFSGWLERVSLRYAQLIGWALQHRKSTLALALLAFGASIGLAKSGWIGSEFMPKTDRGLLVLEMRTPIGTTLDFTVGKAAQVETALREFPEVAQSYATINTGDSPAKHIITTTVRLVPRNQRASQSVLIPKIRTRLEQIGGLAISRVESNDTGKASDAPISITVQGQDLDELKRITSELVDRLKQVPHIVGVFSTIRPPKPSVDITVNRQLAGAVGLSVGQIGQALRPLVTGDPSTVTSWKAPDGDSFDIVVQLPKSERQSLESLGKLPLASTDLDPNTGQQIMIPLAQVAKISETGTSTLIQRRSLNRVLQVFADIEGVPLSKVQPGVAKVLVSMQLPPGYRLVQEGDDQFMTESFGYASTTIGMGILLMYMILATQFRSFLQPLAIMTSLPLALIGAFAALLAWRTTLNLFSVIGIVMLMGLVTKNAILLIDCMNRLCEQGMPRAAALIEAGQLRLRPILMTTFAMIGGMLPLALALGQGSEQRAPMAHAVIGGVVTSTLLTLVVVPVVITYLDDLAAWFGKKAAGATLA